MKKPSKGAGWLWDPAELRPEIARLVNRPIFVVGFGRGQRGPMDEARLLYPTVTGSPTWINSPYGPAMRFANAVVSAPTDYLTYPSGAYPTTSATAVPHSIAILFSPLGTANTSFPFVLDNGGSGVFFYCGGGNNFQVVHGGVVGFSQFGSAITANRWYLWLYSYDLVTMNSLVLDCNTGVVASLSVAETRALAGPMSGPEVANKGSNETFQGAVAGIAWVRGAWSMANMEMIAREPTALWTPDPRRSRRRRRSYFGGVGNIALTVADLAVALAADNVDLTQANTIVVADATLALAIDSPALDPNLAVADSSLALSIESPTLTEAATIAPADAAIALSAESPTLTEAATIAPADATMALGAESPALTQAGTLVANDAAIALGAESPALVQANTLAVADALVALSSESPTLDTASFLAVADALIGLAIESPALVQANTLAVADATLALGIESPSLTEAATIIPADASIALGAENVVLVQANILAVADALVALSSESPLLTVSTLLMIADAVVALSIESPALTVAFLLSVQDATITIVASSPALVQAGTLIVQDALIALGMDGAIAHLDFPPVPKGRTWLVVLDFSTRLVVADHSARLVVTD